VPLTDWAVPYAWGGHVLLSGRNSILRVDPQTMEVRVLASARRNPPASALDRAGDFSNPPLVVWPGDNLHAMVGGQFWRYDATQSDWKALFAATNCGESIQLLPGGAFHRQSGQCRLPSSGWLSGWLPASTGLEQYFSFGRPAARPGPAIWSSPPGWQIADALADFGGSNLWIFPAPMRWSAAIPPRSLLFCDRRFARPRELRLELAGAAADLAQLFDEARGFIGQSFFLPTPVGMAIVLREPGTVLWIPKADLDEAIANAARLDPPPERAEPAAPPK